jgi:thymidylate synthase ThyX
MTHRAFSRNAASSRAIPVERLIADVERDPARPIHWGKNQPGMQAHEELTGDDRRQAQVAWEEACNVAIRMARMMHMAGAHKQIVNRVIEPFSHITVLITTGEPGLENFFALRDHPDAQPEIQHLAKMMKAELILSTPKIMSLGGWHIPYVTEEEKSTLSTHDQLRLSVARCASVSYKTVDGKPMTLERATEICDKLTKSKPFHASPFEHVAIAEAGTSGKPLRNFPYWVQVRQVIEEEFDTST